MSKLSLLLAALLATSAAAAQAGELYAPTQYEQPASGLTRAEVKQSVLRAQKAGELAHNDIDLPGNGTLMSPGDHLAFGKTRAAAKADVLAARERGELNHDDVDLPATVSGSVLTRQEVRADAIASRRLVQTAPGHNTLEY